jgi:hypothetical protein
MAKDVRSELAKARDEWFESDEGQRCCEGGANGQYLRNRLEIAFLAGAAKAMNISIVTAEQKPRKPKGTDHDQGKPVGVRQEDR